MSILDIYLFEGSREDGMEVSGVIVKDNEWVSHGKMTATHPSFAQEEVVNFVYNKTRECCQGLNRSYHFEVEVLKLCCVNQLS